MGAGGRRDRKKKENDRRKGAKERKKERSRVRRERTKEEWERKGKQSPHTITSLVPRCSKKSENSAWYPLFMHTWLPRFSGELGNYCDTSPCCTTVHY